MSSEANSHRLSVDCSDSKVFELGGLELGAYWTGTDRTAGPSSSSLAHLSKQEQPRARCPRPAHAGCVLPLVQCVLAAFFWPWPDVHLFMTRARSLSEELNRALAQQPAFTVLPASLGPRVICRAGRLCIWFSM